MIIALANQKGGVAKTTTCLNLGAGLALRGHKTLLIDTDPQASLSRYLGVHKTEGPPSLGDWLLGRAAFDEAKSATPYDLLDIVSTRETLVGDEAQMEQDKVKMIHYLRLKLREIRNRYDFILIDTMPSFTTLFINSLVAADQVIVPVDLGWLSMQGIPPLIAKIRDVHESVKALQVLGLLGTFYRDGVNESDKCMADLEKILPGKIFSTVIHLNTKLKEAAASGKPIQHYDRSSQGFKDYEALVDEVLARAGVQRSSVAGAK